MSTCDCPDNDIAYLALELAWDSRVSSIRLRVRVLFLVRVGGDGVCACVSLTSRVSGVWRLIFDVLCMVSMVAACLSMAC